MRRCSLDFFCILFCIKAKKHVGFGATPQESMDNAQCTIDWFDDLSIYWWIPIIWGLRVFAPSWRIKVLPSRQVSDDDSCRRMNSAVMKIRLFKPKTLSKTEISIAVEVFNSPANRCLKGNNLHNRRSPTCGQRRPYHYCLKGRTLAVVQMNIHTGKKRTNKTKIRNLKFPLLTS